MIKRALVRILRKITHRPLHSDSLTDLYERGYLAREEYQTAVTEKWINAIAAVSLEDWRKASE